MLLKRIGIICMAIAFLASCKKSDTPGTEVPGPKPPKPDVVTPVGTPDNTPAETKTIGATGGQIFSSDGYLKVIIPAGAFTSDQQVSVQQISNNCPGTHGMAYRVLPEGVTFAKPVTLQFRINMTDSTHLGLGFATAAYQNKKGVWMAMPKAVVNAEARTVSIETTHFSDWTVVSGVMMTANPGLVIPGGKSKLIVYYAEDLLAPLVKEEIPVPGFIEMPSQYVSNWRVTNGLGTVQAEGGKATYTAPAFKPDAAQETATISCDVKSGSNTVTLNTKVTTTHGYISFSVNGGKTQIVHRGVAQRFRYNLGGGQAGPVYTAIYGNATPSTASAPIWIEWPLSLGTTGAWLWKTFTPDLVRIHFLYNGAYYDCSYLPKQGDRDLVISPGYVKVYTDHTHDGYYTGEFEVEKASPTATISEKWRTIHIKGKFRVPTKVDIISPVPF